MGWTKEGNITYYDDVYRAKIPIDMHIGCMGLAPASHSFVDSIPPLPSGGNLDNRRIGKGTTMYYPVEVAGGLLSMGDAHAENETPGNQFGEGLVDGIHRHRIAGIDIGDTCSEGYFAGMGCEKCDGAKGVSAHCLRQP